jgi:hypothetical protein
MKPTVVCGCYFCEKGVEPEALAMDEEGNVIQSDSPRLKDSDNHFICKLCYQKVQAFFNVEE